MDCARNIITANFSGGGTSATTAPLWQWDYGQVLCITGLDLPAAFEVHFSTNKTGGVSTTAVGADGQVTIPNVLLTIGKNLNAWIYLSDSEGEGETEYSITIPVKARPIPETYDVEATGEFDDVVRQVSEYAETAQTAADNAGASASAAATSASEAAASASAAESAKTAAETAQGKAEDAQAAAETAAQTATEKAQQTAQDASQAASDAGRAESAAERAESAETGAGAAKTAAEAAAQNAAASAATADEKATLAGQSATAAAGSASAAAQSAASIEGDVQIASQKASEAQTAAGQAVTAKDAAVTAQQGAETAATNAGQSASTATAKASEAATSASNAAQSKTDAEAAAARAEQAAATLTVDSALSDSSTNPVQNKVITSEITDVKTALKYNVNAIDKSMEFVLVSPTTVTSGWKITSSGNPTQDADYQIDKYAVTAGTLLRVNLIKDGDVVYTFSEDISVSASKLVGYPNFDAVDGYVVVPQSATYLMICRLRTNSTDVVKTCTSVTTNLSRLVANMGDELDNFESILSNNLIDRVEQINLYDKNSTEIEEGYYFAPAVTAGASYSLSGYIQVGNGKAYSWFSDANALICLYDSSKTYLGYVRGSDLVQSKTYTATVNNSDCVYARFSYKTASKDGIMFVEGNTYPQTYYPYIAEEYYRLKGDIDTNPLYGKKVGVMGDSIMYGEGYKDGAIGIIASKNSMALSNKAVSGAKITISGSAASIYNQLALLDADCDYIIFDGGVNDMLDDNLGVITTGFNATYDESTFSGSFEKLVHDIVATFPTKKIGYVSVHRLKQWEGDSYSSYANTGYYTRAMEILAKWGIPVCDLTKGTLSLYENSALKSLYTKNGDGWHPNENGYKYFYCDKIESWLKTL